MCVLCCLVGGNTCELALVETAANLTPYSTAGSTVLLSFEARRGSGGAASESPNVTAF